MFNFDTVIHELMHSLGFIHEQSRPDRDLYVNIHLNNIKSGREREFREHITSMKMGFLMIC